jgi:hypothetical protein
MLLKGAFKINATARKIKKKLTENVVATEIKYTVLQ